MGGIWGRTFRRGIIQLWLALGMGIAGAMLGRPSRCACQDPVMPPPPVDDGGQTDSNPAPVAGNVIEAGAALWVRIPDLTNEQVVRVEARDETGQVVSDAPVGPGLMAVFHRGTLPPGWYQLRLLDASGQVQASTTAAVLRSFEGPWDPERNPVAVDMAVSWLAPFDIPDASKAMIRLARMAGTGWVRDRLRWRELQTGPDAWAETSQYDRTAVLQQEAGLKVLSVFHDIPVWARNQDDSQTDLRYLYRFCEGLARRLRGYIDAWEPWNEANARNFGGWPIHRMCAWQKAAYLGFKAGDPAVPVCWQPIGGVNTAAQVRGILDSGVPAYCDVYAIHSYDWAHSFKVLWSEALRAASGKPLWVTEIDRGIAGDGTDSLDDLPPERALLKAQYIPQEYALAMACGADRIFHFILADYSEIHAEQPIRFGLLRRDLTPRPAYVSLAVTARMLAGTECLGVRRFEEAPDLWAAGFRSLDPGRGDVLLMWAERDVEWHDRGKTVVDYTLPRALRGPRQCVDYLGRDVPVPTRFSGVPVFMSYPRGALTIWFDQLDDRLPQKNAAGTLARVVLDAWFSENPPRSFPAGWTPEFYPLLHPGPQVLRIAVYHLSDQGALTGAIRVSGLPAGWQVDPERLAFSLGPMDRAKLEMSVTVPEDPGPADADQAWWIRLTAEHDAGTVLDTLAVAVRCDR